MNFMCIGLYTIQDNSTYRTTPIDGEKTQKVEKRSVGQYLHDGLMWEKTFENKKVVLWQFPMGTFSEGS